MTSTGRTFPSAGAVHWRCLPFAALSAHTLYRVLRLRSEVFVVEQNCVFQDMDGSDAPAMHLLGEQRSSGGQVELLAYARLFGAGIKYKEASIGRVATASSARGTGLGHALMAQAVTAVHSLWGVQPIRIGAQSHLQSYYQKHGFEPIGPRYLEDGIDHIEMLFTPAPCAGARLASGACAPASHTELAEGRFRGVR